jgi:hypothetical protein
MEGGNMPKNWQAENFRMSSCFSMRNVLRLNRSCTVGVVDTVDGAPAEANVLAQRLLHEMQR